jgi:archaellum biogenesis ATPase FlaH
MESCTYFAALGAKDSGIPAGSEVLVEYQVDLGHSLLSVLISIGAIFIGAVLMYYGRE